MFKTSIKVPRNEIKMQFLQGRRISFEHLLSYFETLVLQQLSLQGVYQ
jgi:hypothetical protein